MQNVKKPHKYIAAVSGGPDSMAMLDMFHNDIIAVCHVNYHKRDSAKRDETIVKQFCKMHGIPFEKLDATTKLLEQYDTNNFQTSARLLRYDFFAKIAKKHNTFSLLVAHNKDDFVETAIMQQERHSIALFLGIPAQQQFKTLRIERPLLNKRKRDLLKYCDQHNISYGIDETNFEDMYTRNRIRKEILQWNNKEFNSKYLSFKKFNMQNAKLRNKVEQEYENWSKKAYDLAVFRILNSDMQIRMMYLYLISNNVHKISSAKIKLIIQFLSSPNNKGCLRLGRQQKLYKNTGRISIRTK